VALDEHRKPGNTRWGRMMILTCTSCLFFVGLGMNAAVRSLVNTHSRPIPRLPLHEQWTGEATNDVSSTNINKRESSTMRATPTVSSKAKMEVAPVPQTAHGFTSQSHAVEGCDLLTTGILIISGYLLSAVLIAVLTAILVAQNSAANSKAEGGQVEAEDSREGKRGEREGNSALGGGGSYGTTATRTAPGIACESDGRILELQKTIKKLRMANESLEKKLSAAEEARAAAESKRKEMKSVLASELERLLGEREAVMKYLYEENGPPASSPTSGTDRPAVQSRRISMLSSRRASSNLVAKRRRRKKEKSLSIGEGGKLVYELSKTSVNRPTKSPPPS